MTHSLKKKKDSTTTRQKIVTEAFVPPRSCMLVQCQKVRSKLRWTKTNKQKTKTRIKYLIVCICTHCLEMKRSRIMWNGHKYYKICFRNIRIKAFIKSKLSHCMFCKLFLAGVKSNTKQEAGLRCVFWGQIVRLKIRWKYLLVATSKLLPFPKFPFQSSQQHAGNRTDWSTQWRLFKSWFPVSSTKHLALT